MPLATRAIFALDQKGVGLRRSDPSVDVAILCRLNKTGCGNRIYSYLSDFLTGRQAVLKIRDTKSKPISLGSRGTPQGSVLLLPLFNIAFLGLPGHLEQIPNLHPALHADDIILSTDIGSLGGLQDTAACSRRSQLLRPTLFTAEIRTHHHRETKPTISRRAHRNIS